MIKGKDLVFFIDGKPIAKSNEAEVEFTKSFTLKIPPKPEIWTFYMRRKNWYYFKDSHGSRIAMELDETNCDNLEFLRKLKYGAELEMEYEMESTSGSVGEKNVKHGDM